MPCVKYDIVCDSEKLRLYFTLTDNKVKIAVKVFLDSKLGTYYNNPWGKVTITKVPGAKISSIQITFDAAKESF